MKKLSLEIVKTLISERIFVMQYNVAVYERVANILKYFEGKTISKKIATEFTKFYPYFDCYLSSDNNMYYLCIRKKGTKGFKKFLISYKSESIVVFKSIENITRGFKYEKKQLNTAYKLLKDEIELIKIVNIYNNYLLYSIEINKLNENLFLIYSDICEFMDLMFGKIQYFSEKEIEEFEK